MNIWLKAQRDIMAGMATAFPLTTVTPYGGGSVVQVKLKVGKRSTSSADLTGGVDQDGQLATIDADDWDMNIGRPPQKGDIITWAGQRFAVDDCQVASVDGTHKSVYKARLRG